METEISSLQSQQPTTRPYYNRDQSVSQPHNSPTADPNLTEINPFHSLTAASQQSNSRPYPNRDESVSQPQCSLKTVQQQTLS
jgi:hypothetical protein